MPYIGDYVEIVYAVLNGFHPTRLNNIEDDNVIVQRMLGSVKKPNHLQQTDKNMYNNPNIEWYCLCEVVLELLAVVRLMHLYFDTWDTEHIIILRQKHRVLDMMTHSKTLLLDDPVTIQPVKNYTKADLYSKRPTIRKRPTKHANCKTHIAPFTPDAREMTLKRRYLPSTVIISLRDLM
ncbi:hypothetical protein TNCV_5122621 [Trichonephila clavipes]|nr:hypothetical protein TNCV_5122621 [Trichonephila clavipes]